MPSITIPAKNSAATPTPSIIIPARPPPPPKEHAKLTEGGNQQHTLLPFLQQQPPGSLSRLYQRPSSCLCVFRVLGSLERQLIMNLLWLESPIPNSSMTLWMNKLKKHLYDTALFTLSRLNIVPKPTTNLALEAVFKFSLRQAMTCGGTIGSFGVPAEPDPAFKAPDIQTLDGYALERWETILHYMVSAGSDQNTPKPSSDVLFLLKTSGLMANNEHALQITSAGFQFLLNSPHSQLWDLLLQYLKLADARRMDLIEILSFLFMLSTMELGREYTTEGCSETQKAMLVDFRDYGLIWQRKADSTRFSPTRLSTTLTSSSPPLPTSVGKSALATRSKTHGQGFIVLETNYKVYAYTENPLQTAVLNLFVSLKYRFPNLVVGTITRDSVRRALTNGISADQIISYLIAYAHPLMRKNDPLLPVTVQDQIRLWELERNRLKSREGYLYKDFASQADFEFVLNYAKELDVVLYENHAKRCFFATLEAHPNIRGFIERRVGR